MDTQHALTQLELISHVCHEAFSSTGISGTLWSNGISLTEYLPHFLNTLNNIFLSQRVSRYCTFHSQHV